MCTKCWVGGLYVQVLWLYRCVGNCTGALFDVHTSQAHAAFRFEMERFNNASASTFKLDKYEKIVDVTDSFQLAKAGQLYFEYIRLLTLQRRWPVNSNIRRDISWTKGSWSEDLDCQSRAIKVKYADIAVRSLTCHTATGTHMPYRITQCYLPPDRGNIPAFTPNRSWCSIKRLRGDARLSWPSCLVHTEMVYPPEDRHPSKH